MGGAATEPVVALQRELSYPMWQQAIDHTAQFGWLNYWKSVYVTELTDEAIRHIAMLGRSRPTPQTRLHVIRLGGAAGRIDSAATAVSNREQPYLLHVMTTWTDPDDTDRCTAWANHADDMLRPLGRPGRT